MPSTSLQSLPPPDTEAQGEPTRKRAMCLVPYDRREVMFTAEAAATYGDSPGTIRANCERYRLATRVGSSRLHISRVAMRMFYENDGRALMKYLSGDRTSPEVVSYYEREGLGDLIAKWRGR